MQTSIAIEKLINVAPIIADLRPKLKGDEKFKAFIEEYKKNDGNVDNVDFLLRFLPLISKSCEKEIYEILSIFCDKSVDEIKAQSFGKTIGVVKELLTDEDVRSFFIDA